MNVPALPLLDKDLVDAHAAAHAELAARLDAAERPVRQLFTMLQHRLMIESLAYVQPIIGAQLRPPIAPAPRAFLTHAQELRLQGARAAFRHLDSRIAMRRLGAVPSVLERASPLVLHALLEGPSPSARETNAGMLRATPTSWRHEVSSFAHPPAERCAELVDAAISMALEAPAPACARAAWLTFTMLSVHPFVDGNGRTSRALYLAVACEALPLGMDWGIAEQWSLHRSEYVDALQEGQGMEGYDPDVIDALPFMVFSTRESIAGVELALRRIDTLEARLDEVVAALDVAAEQAAAVVAIELLRNASPYELLVAGFDAQFLDEVIAGLLRAGVVRWAERPASRRTCEDRAEYGLVVARA